VNDWVAFVAFHRLLISLITLVFRIFLRTGAALAYGNTVLGDDDAFLNITNLRKIGLAEYSPKLRKP